MEKKLARSQRWSPEHNSVATLADLQLKRTRQRARQRSLLVSMDRMEAIDIILYFYIIDHIHIIHRSYSYHS
jgi:hypothetical protein